MSCHCHLQSLYCWHTQVFRNKGWKCLRKSEEKQFLFSSEEFSAKCSILGKDSVRAIEGWRGCSPCAWASGQGSDCPITPDKFNFTSTKKTAVLFVQTSFDKEASRSHLRVQPSTNNDFLSQIFLSAHRETKLTKQTPGLPSFTGESTITWTLSHFSPWVCICFNRTNFMHEIVLILCIQSAIIRRVTETVTSQREAQFKSRVQKCSLKYQHKFC